MEFNNLIDPNLNHIPVSFTSDDIKCLDSCICHNKTEDWVQISGMLFIVTLKLRKGLSMSDMFWSDLSKSIDDAASTVSKAPLEVKIIYCNIYCSFICSAKMALKSSTTDSCALRSLVNRLIVFIVELIRGSLCANQICESLMYSGFIDVALIEGVHSFRQVLCAAITAYSRRICPSGDASVSKMIILNPEKHDIWAYVSERALTLIDKDKSNMNHLIFLGWLLQQSNTSNDVSLSTAFIEQAFRDGSNFALLQVPLTQATVLSYSSETLFGGENMRTLKFPNGSFCISVAVNSIPTAIMRAGSLLCLGKSLNAFFSSETTGCHLVESCGFEISTSTRHPLSSSYGFVSYYVDLLDTMNFLNPMCNSLSFSTQKVSRSTARRIGSYHQINKTSTDMEPLKAVGDASEHVAKFVQQCLPSGQKLFCSFPLQSLIIMITAEVVEKEHFLFEGIRSDRGIFHNTSTQGFQSFEFLSLITFVVNLLQACEKLSIRSSLDQLDSVLNTRWLNALGNILVYFLKCLKHCQRTISVADPQVKDHEFEHYIHRPLFGALIEILKVRQLLLRRLAEAEEKIDSHIIWTKVNSEVEPVIKLCLKHFICDLDVVELLNSLLIVLNERNLLSVKTDGFEVWNPLPFLQLLCSHSRFSEAISSGINNAQSRKQHNGFPILELLQSCLNRFPSKVDDEETVRNFLQFILLEVLDGYSGTMSSSDVRILDILFLIESLLRSVNSIDTDENITLPLNLTREISSLSNHNLAILNKKQLSKRSGPKKGFGLRRCSQYLRECLSQSTIYSTLSRFPFGRKFTVPISMGGSLAHEASKVESSVQYWWNEESHSVDDTLDENILAPHSDETVYDPLFWLIVICHSLKEPGTLSTRNLANSGVVSLVIVSLGSSCKIMRVLALSCLHEIHGLALAQTPEKDISFRERPQLLLLFDFIKNSFGVDDANMADSSVSHVPGLTAVFCARAAMHLLQSGHELYGIINKYILSRPFCDPKDVPLFDYLVTTSDASTKPMERLAAVRLLRDGLCSKEDHLSLCRKNGYSKILLLFPMVCCDVKIGHAIFDVLEKALLMPSSARYLLERCELLVWLKGVLCFPVCAGPEHKSENEPVIASAAFIGCPTKLLFRGVILLRYIIAALHTLRNVWSCAETTVYLKQISCTVRSMAQELISSNFIDCFQQFLYVLWDLHVFSLSHANEITYFGSLFDWFGCELVHKLFLFSDSVQKSKTGLQSHSSRACANSSLSMALLLSLDGPIFPMNPEQSAFSLVCDILNRLVGASLLYFYFVPDEKISYNQFFSVCACDLSGPETPQISGCSNSNIERQLLSYLRDQNRGISQLRYWHYMGRGTTTRDFPIAELTPSLVMLCSSKSAARLVRAIVTAFKGCDTNCTPSNFVIDTISSVLRWSLLMISVVDTVAGNCDKIAEETKYYLLYISTLSLIFISCNQEGRPNFLHGTMLQSFLSPLISLWNYLTLSSVNASSENSGKVDTYDFQGSCIDKSITEDRIALSHVLHQVSEVPWYKASEFFGRRNTTRTRYIFAFARDYISAVCSVIDREKTVAMDNEMISYFQCRTKTYGEHIQKLIDCPVEDIESENAVTSMKEGTKNEEKDSCSSSSFVAHSLLLPGHTHQPNKSLLNTTESNISESDNSEAESEHDGFSNSTDEDDTSTSSEVSASGDSKDVSTSEDISIKNNFLKRSMSLRNTETRKKKMKLG